MAKNIDDTDTLIQNYNNVNKLLRTRIIILAIFFMLIIGLQNSLDRVLRNLDISYGQCLDYNTWQIQTLSNNILIVLPTNSHGIIKQLHLNKLRS